MDGQEPWEREFPDTRPPESEGEIQKENSHRDSQKETHGWFAPEELVLMKHMGVFNNTFVKTVAIIILKQQKMNIDV